MDPIALFSVYIIHIYATRIYITMVILSVFSLFEVKTIKKNIFLFILIIILGIIISWFGTIKLLTVCLIFLHLITFIIFFKFSLIEFHKEDHINLFYLLLCIYEISLLLKFIIVITDIKTGAELFFITSSFEIFIAIYFIIYNEITSPKIKLKLSS